MKKEKIPLLIIIIVVVVLIVLAGVLGIIKKQGGLKSTEIANEIYGFSAEITKIQDKTLFLKASLPTTDVEQGLLEKNVKGAVTDTTKLATLKFPEKITDPNKPVVPEETPLNFTDLKVGDKIDLATGENVSEKIKKGEVFNITQIFIIAK